jgi:hypothetical protein
MEMIVAKPALTDSGTSWLCSFSASSQIALNALVIFSVLRIFYSFLFKMIVEKAIDIL